MDTLADLRTGSGIQIGVPSFPCQKEGFDTGCEAYKKIPVFVASDAVVYSAILLSIVHLWRTMRSKRHQNNDTKTMMSEMAILQQLSIVSRIAHT